MREISETARALLLKYQRTEATDHLVYRRMAAREKNMDNRKTLERISANERDHEAVFQRYTGQKVRPDRFRVFWFSLLSFLFGYTFVLKLMEKGEYAAGGSYRALVGEFPEIEKIIADEQRHESELAGLLDEERLKYVGAMVLGLNDALVELSGAVAGLTLAMADTRVVALAGIITGASATLSMAASNYLAQRAEGQDDALKSSLYTGIAYLATVVCLITPYLLFPPGLYLAALATMLVIVLLIIMLFNYYVAVAKSVPFGSRFREMAAISFGVMAISFVIGLLAKKVLGVDI